MSRQYSRPSAAKPPSPLKNCRSGGKSTGSSFQSARRLSRGQRLGMRPSPFDPIKLAGEGAPRSVEQDTGRGLEQQDIVLGDPFSLEHKNATGPVDKIARNRHHEPG